MSFFFFNDTATTEIYTLSLHDALPISRGVDAGAAGAAILIAVLAAPTAVISGIVAAVAVQAGGAASHLKLFSVDVHGMRPSDRKSTRLNSSHSQISYAVFCLKKKTRKPSITRTPGSPTVFEMAATETIMSIILIKLTTASLSTVRHAQRFNIVVIDIQITLKKIIRYFICISVNHAKKNGMGNITSSVNRRERSDINNILHQLNPLFIFFLKIMATTNTHLFPRLNPLPT